MNQGALHFESTLDDRSFLSGINRINNGIRSASQTAKKEAGAMDSTFRNLGLAVGSYFSGQALFSFAKQLINVRGEFQKTEIAFTTMLGSGEKAKDLMGQMVKLAAETPFSLQEVSTGAKQLLAFQVPANQVVDVLTRMGNIAAGLGVPLSRLNLVYGQVKAKGRLMGDDLRQFTEAGIPMIAELAKKFNVTSSAITEMVTAGKVGFKDVEEVLFSMTNEGGMFFNLMEKQSKSVSGQISNLGDSFDQTLNKIGAANEGLISGGIGALAYLVENYEDLAEIIAVVIAAYGAYKAALIATLVWQRLNETAAYQQALAQGSLTYAQSLGAAATIELSLAQRGLNAALMANPIGVVIGLVAALSYVIYKNVSATSAMAEMQEKINENTRAANDSLSEQKGKMETMISVIKNKNTTDEVAQATLARLNTLTNNRIKGLTVESIRLGKSTEAIGAYIKALELEARAKTLVQSKMDAEQAIRDVDRDDFRKLSIGERVGNFDEWGDLLKSAQERKLESMVLKKAAANKIIRDANAQLKALTDAGVNILGDSGNKEVEALNKSTGELKKEKVKHERELAEIYSKGSIADLEQRIGLWNEALQKSSGDNVEILSKDKFGDTVKTGNYVRVDDALKEVESLEKAKTEREKILRKQSFDQELTELERQWSIKNKMSETYGEEYAKAAYPQLEGSYFNDITKQFKVFDDEVKKGGTLSEEQLTRWSRLKEILDGLGGEDSRSQKVVKEMSIIKEEAKNTSEYLERIQAEQKKYSEDKSFEGLKISEFLKSEEESALLVLRSSYLTFLQEHQSFEEKRLAVALKYATLRNQIMSDKGLTPEGRNRALKEAGKAEGKELSDMFLQGMREDPEWGKAFEDMSNVALSKLKALRSNLSAQLAGMISSGQGTPEQLKALRDIIQEIDGQILTRNPFKALAEAIKNMGNESDNSKTKLEKLKDLAKAVGASASLLNEGITTGVGIAEDLGVQFSEETKGIIQDVQTTIGGIGDIAEGIASMNPGQILKGIGSVIKGLAGLFNGDRKKEKNIKRWATEVENLKIQYEALQRAIQQALGEDSYKQQQQAIQNLRQQQDLIRRMSAEEGRKKKGDKDKIAEMNAQIASIDNQIADMFQNMADQIAQTNTKDLASTLADALIDAYGKGEDAATAYGKVADDVMKNAVKNALKMQLLEGPMQAVIKQLIKNMGFAEDGTGSFDGLTEEERAQIKAMMQQASQNYMDALGAYSDLFGEASNTSLEGAVKGVNQETASIIAGQMNAIRNNQGEMLTISQESILIFRTSYLQLVQIEYNTRYLKYIYRHISGSDIDPFRSRGIT